MALGKWRLVVMAIVSPVVAPPHGFRPLVDWVPKSMAFTPARISTKQSPSVASFKHIMREPQQAVQNWRHNKRHQRRPGCSVRRCRLGCFRLGCVHFILLCYASAMVKMRICHNLLSIGCVHPVTLITQREPQVSARISCSTPSAYCATHDHATSYGHHCASATADQLFCAIVRAIRKP